MDGDKTDVEEPNAKRIRTSSSITRPNFFVAVQVSNPLIHRAVNTIQNIVTSKKPLYKSVLIKLITLHITLCTLHLARNADIRRAKSAMQKLETDMKEMLLREPITLKFKGIGAFKNEVVFAKVEAGDQLQRITELHINLVKALKDEGLIVKDKFDPHLTIMKMSKDWKLRKKKIYKIPKDLYEENSEMEFGEQPVRGVQLLMIRNRAEKGYYNCYHHFDFGSHDNELEDHEDCCGVKSVIPNTLIELGPEELDDEAEVLDEKMNINDLETAEGNANNKKSKGLDKKLSFKEKRKRKGSLRRAERRALLFGNKDRKPSGDERLEMLHNLFQGESADVSGDQAIEMIPSLFQDENVTDKGKENQGDEISNDLISFRYDKTSLGIIKAQDGNTIADVIESQEERIDLELVDGKGKLEVPERIGFELVDGKGKLEVPDGEMTFEAVESVQMSLDARGEKLKDEETKVVEANANSSIKEKSNFEAMDVQEENVNIVASEAQETNSNVDISVAEEQKGNVGNKEDVGANVVIFESSELQKILMAHESKKKE